MIPVQSLRVKGEVFFVHRPDIKERLFFLVSGMIISIPFVILVGTLASNFLNAAFPYFINELFLIVIIAPILEEFAKAYPLFYRHGETERSIVSLGFYSGLGFGIIEFLFYIFIFKAALIPRIFAVIFHASSTSIVAYGISQKKTFFFYLIAVILHFCNNFLAVSQSPWVYASIAVIIATFLLALFLRLESSNLRPSG